MRSPDDKNYCPLFQKTILWGGAGGCYEVQEAREDNMDAELFPNDIDIAKANSICQKCGWYRAED